MLDLVEEPLDTVARLVNVLAEADSFLAFGLGRNVRLCVLVCQHLAQRVGVVTLVGQKQSAFGKVGDHLERASDVCVLARCRLELEWPTLLVDDRLDFGRDTASEPAQTTNSPPFLPSRPADERERSSFRRSGHHLHGLE